MPNAVVNPALRPFRYCAGMSSLKDRLKESLAKAGLSQAELARATKSSRASITDWLNGNTKTIEATRLLAAASRLGVDPEWLATGKRSAAGVRPQQTYTITVHNGRTEKLLAIWDQLPEESQDDFLVKLEEAAADFARFRAKYGHPVAKERTDAVLPIAPRVKPKTPHES